MCIRCELAAHAMEEHEAEDALQKVLETYIWMCQAMEIEEDDVMDAMIDSVEMHFGSNYTLH